MKNICLPIHKQKNARLSFKLTLPVFFVILSFSCGKKTSSSAAAPPIQAESGRQSADKDTTAPAVVPLNEQNMESVAVKIGQSIQIRFPGNPEPDYTWYYQVSEDWIISMTEPYDYPSKSANPDAPPVPAASKEQVYDVKGLKKGTVTIRFYKIRAWKQDEKPKEERFYKVIVD
jgi:predicted secreted protein